MTDFSANIAFDYATSWTVKLSVGFEPVFRSSQDERKTSKGRRGGLDRDFFIILPEKGHFLKSDFLSFRRYSGLFGLINFPDVDLP